MSKKKTAKPKPKRILQSRPTPPAVPRRRPRNVPLPGLEDRGIAELDDAAIAYAELQDQRKQLQQQEIGLKAKLKSLMHRHQRTLYACDGVVISVVPGEELIKVRVRPIDVDAARDVDDQGNATIDVPA